MARNPGRSVELAHLSGRCEKAQPRIAAILGDLQLEGVLMDFEDRRIMGTGSRKAVDAAQRRRASGLVCQLHWPYLVLKQGAVAHSSYFKGRNVGLCQFLLLALCGA